MIVGQSDDSGRLGVRVMLAVYIAGAIGASIHRLTRPLENNFAIFRDAFFNLVAGRDLYASYPTMYFDKFKYSPSFAFLIGPIAALPSAIGLTVWNLLNALALWWVLARLFPPAQAWKAIALVALELFGSLQTAQSNGLVTALVILAWLSLDEGKPVRGAVAVALGTAIKIFPLAAVTLALLDARRIRFFAALAISGIAIIALPLIVISPSVLVQEYRSWLAVLQSDALNGVTHFNAHQIGGVMEQLRLWAGVHWANWPVELAGTLVLILPLVAVRARWVERPFRLRFLASLLIYMVIFNHQAESPSFVIAMTGIVVWYFAAERGPVDLALLIGALLLTSISSSELTPHDIRVGFVRDYGVKAIPSIVIWLVLQAELLGLRRERPRHENAAVGEAEPGLAAAP